MPYFQDPNLEDDENTQDPGGQGFQLSGGSGTTDSDGNAGSGGGNSPKKEGLKTGSGFQNLDSYLNTNQSKEFGQQVLGKVGGEIDSAKQNQAQAADQFKSQVSTANRLPTMDNVNSAIANPTGADKNEFQQWQSQTYQGPKSLGESQDTWNKYWSGSNKANTQAKLLGSEAGRFSLLDSYYGKPNYSFGEKSLDNLLVQQSGLGKETRGLQNDAALLKSQGDQGARELQNAASVRAGEVDQNRQQVRGAIGLDDQGNVITGDKAGAIGQQYQAVQSSVEQQNAARQAAQAQLKDHIAQNKLTPEEMASLGLTSGQSLYNLDLNNYLQLGDSLNRDQVMTSEQRAQIRALSDLAGVQDNYANGESVDPGNPYTFDKSAIGNARGQAESNYKQDAFNTARNIYGWGPETTQTGDSALSALKQAYDLKQSGKPLSQYGIDAAKAWESLQSKYTPNRKLS